MERTVLFVPPFGEYEYAQAREGGISKDIPIEWPPFPFAADTRIGGLDYVYLGRFNSLLELEFEFKHWG